MPTYRRGSTLFSGDTGCYTLAGADGPEQYGSDGLCAFTSAAGRVGGHVSAAAWVKLAFWMPWRRLDASVSSGGLGGQHSRNVPGPSEGVGDRRACGRRSDDNTRLRPAAAEGDRNRMRTGIAANTNRSADARVTQRPYRLGWTLTPPTYDAAMWRSPVRRTSTPSGRRCA